MLDAIKMMVSKIKIESVALSRLMAEQEILRYRQLKENGKTKKRELGAVKEKFSKDYKMSYKELFNL